MEQLTSDTSVIESYLREQEWLKRSEKLQSLENPGDGNMNFTLRVITDRRSFILKQSRDFVEKYPQVAAPRERVLSEADFYELLETQPRLKKMTPEVLEVDPHNCVMLMSDLGAGTDYSYLYQSGKQIDTEELTAIVDFASDLHRNIRRDNTPNHIRNREMRKLNHQHIFQYPFLADNGLNLNEILPGLEAAAESLKKDDRLKARAQELGEVYLADGGCLLHGDYFPGSWLATKSGLKIIDPEFCFFGPAEFDLGVCLAHLRMADQESQSITLAFERYQNSHPIDEDLCHRFTAIEVIRRIIGLAQLPLEIDLGKRKALLDEAHEILTR